MGFVDSVSSGVGALVRTVVDHTPRATTVQSITIGRPRTEVLQFWADPGRLSQVLGDRADVEHTEADDYRWTVDVGAAGSLEWRTTLEREDGTMRFVGVDGGGAHAELLLRFADAPQDLGTEVTARIVAPIPRALAGALAYAALYRSRALLLTGELPTLDHNPSGRAPAPRA